MLDQIVENNVSVIVINQNRSCDFQPSTIDKYLSPDVNGVFRMHLSFRNVTAVAGALAFALSVRAARAEAPTKAADWTSANHFRVPLTVAPTAKPNSRP